MHAKLNGHQVEKYPIRNIRREFPHLSLPANLTNDDTLPPGIVYVWNTDDVPDFDPQTQDLVEINPTRKNGRWERTFKVVPKPPEEINQIKEEKRQHMVVSRFQAKAALAQIGLLEQVEEMMADEETPIIARLAWEDALEFRRLSPTILSMAAALELSKDQLDDLFETAKSIEA